MLLILQPITLDRLVLRHKMPLKLYKIQNLEMSMKISKLFIGSFELKFFSFCNFYLK